MSEVWRGSTSAEMWAEIEALRRSNAAHVDTIMAAVARAEAAEARIAALTEALSEVLAEYDRQMAAESWRSSRGVGYAEVQITTQEADAFRAAMKVEEPTDG